MQKKLIAMTCSLYIAYSNTYIYIFTRRSILCIVKILTSNDMEPAEIIKT